VINQEIETPTKIESIFVRKRNVLFIRASFSEMFTDYYLHLMEQKIRHTPELDLMLKEQLAMLSLHLVARPWRETIAWTANLRAPRINLFVSGGSTEASITGRIFTEDVREPDRNYFYSQTLVQGGSEPSQSTMEAVGRNPLQWISQYYEQSEQRMGRAFYLGDDNYVLLAAQPEADLEWLESLDAEKVLKIDQEETNLLETRFLRFNCGCNREKILTIVESWNERLDDIFHGDESIFIQCPRCAARYEVTREFMETRKLEN
jgi:molecular chaperone Hsp33